VREVGTYCMKGLLVLSISDMETVSKTVRVSYLTTKRKCEHIFRSYY